MSVQPKDPGLVPPGGVFWYVQPESGQRFEHAHLSTLIGNVREHRHANGFPVGSQFQREITDFACKQLGDFCTESAEPMSFTQRMAHFGKSLVQFVGQGMTIVSEQELSDRYKCCEGDENTAPCVNWRGDRGLLEVACGACGCSSVKLKWKSEVCKANRWKKLV